MGERKLEINRITGLKDGLNIISFCALMLFFLALIFFAPSDKKAGALEHRTLSKAPELNLRTALNGEFSRQFESFIADQVGFRTDFIMISKSIERAYGITLRDEPIVLNISAREREGAAGAPALSGSGHDGNGNSESGNAGRDNDGNSEANSSAEPAPGSNRPETQTPEHDTATGADERNYTSTAAATKDAEPVRAGPVLAFPDRLIELYGYSERACIRYAEVINAYARAFEGKARVFSLIAPTQVEFIDAKYRSLSDSQYEAIMTVNDRLENVRPVDAYSYISEHSGEYVYFKTDHHWTALGTYYAYLAYCEVAGLTPKSLEDYDRFELPGFLGFLYSINPVHELKENPDVIVYYELKEPIDLSGRLIYKPIADEVTYSLFIGGDTPLFKIKTSVDNGKTCAVIKDSYGNAFIPWLAPHYEHIVVFDPRKFNGSVAEELDEYENVDLIILNSAFTVGSGGFNDMLVRIA